MKVCFSHLKQNQCHCDSHQREEQSCDEHHNSGTHVSAEKQHCGNPAASGVMVRVRWSSKVSGSHAQCKQNSGPELLSHDAVRKRWQ